MNVGVLDDVRLFHAASTINKSVKSRQTGNNEHHVIQHLTRWYGNQVIQSGVFSHILNLS